MNRIIFAALLLSACAPDWCHQNRVATATCMELLRLGKVAECQCQTSTSGKVEPTVIVTPPEPPPTGCDGGHDSNCDGVGGDPVGGLK